MALVHVHFYSSALGMQRAMDVVLPRRKDGEKLPVLYLLHGGTDDHTIWQRKTSIERYAEERGLAVVMPSSDLGFYTDMKYGYDFFTFLADELPGIVAEFFPGVSQDPADTFAAGLSMGGFGAFKLGILRPGRFAAVASLSGMVDLNWVYPDPESPAPFRESYGWMYGDREEMVGSENDLPFQLEKRIASGEKMPRFYMACGTEDFLYETNVKFRDRFMGRMDLTYYEEPGTHEWGFWDRNIQRVLDWLPVREAAKGGR